MSPFSGDGAVYGEIMKEGLGIALDELKVSDPDFYNKIKIIYEDDRLKEREGRIAIDKLINVDGVHVIVGPFNSNVTLAVADFAESHKIPVISPTATNYKIKDAGDYIFRVCPSDSYQGKIQADFVFNKLGKKKVAVLYINTDYGLGLSTIFQEHFKSLGGEIVTVEAFDQGATDLRAQLQKVKRLGAEVIFMPSNWQEAATLINQAKELGIDGPFIATDGTYEDRFLELTKGSSEGLIISSMAWGSGEAKPISDAFKEKYQQKYGREPGLFAGLCYDTMKIVLQILKKTGPDPEAIKNELYKVDYLGVTGRTQFDSFGEVEKPFGLYTVKDNRFVELDESNLNY